MNNLLHLLAFSHWSSHWLHIEASPLLTCQVSPHSPQLLSGDLAAGAHNYVITCVCLSQGPDPMMRLGNCPSSEVTILIQIGEAAPKRGAVSCEMEL